MEEEKKFNIDDRKYTRKRRRQEVDEYIERKYGTPKWVKRLAAAGLAGVTFVTGYGAGFKQGQETAKKEQIEEKAPEEVKNTVVPLVTVTPKSTDNVKYEPWYTPVPTPSNKFFTNIKGISPQVREAINNTANYYTIKDCIEYENLLNTNDTQRLVEQGLGFSAQLASNIARGYIAQAEGVDYPSIIATYEKKQMYNFHIRSRYERYEQTALELENGKIKLGITTMKKYPSEVYELLIYCGSMKEYIIETGVDIQKYADERTEGDVEKAKAEIISVQKENYEKVKKFIYEKCKDKEIEER